MTISYTFDRKTAAKGISRSTAYRTPIRRFLIPVLGLIFLAYSAKQLLSEQSGSSSLGIILLPLGILYLCLPILQRWRAVKNLFAGRRGYLDMKITVLDEGIEIRTEGSSGTATWPSFVDGRICKDGILLYPQKMLHYWIPKSATVEGGTWQDFESLVSSEIQRKI